MKNDLNIGYKGNLYNIVSRVAYLIGTNHQLFATGENLQNEVYLEMEQISQAKILRSLSILRTCLLKNYKEIEQKIIYDLKNINSLPEYFDPGILRYLSKQGIEVNRPNTKPSEYIGILSELISKYVADAVKLCFPIWIKQDYIKELFAMKYRSPKDANSIVGNFAVNKRKFPYQMYINFPFKDSGNILFNDDKFVHLLYQVHGEEFTDSSKVLDMSQDFKTCFQDFMDNAGDIYIMVDCENTKVYKLYSMLKDIQDNYPRLFQKIKCIELYDDIHTTNAWKLLHRFTNIQIKHNLTQRVKEEKSLVDIHLSAGTCKAFYEKDIRDFILVSSDSDFFGLIGSLPECNFIAMVERDQVSNSVLDAMNEYDISYCFIDDFYSGDMETLYADTLKMEINEFLKTKTVVEIDRLFANAAHSARLEFRKSELDSYMKKYQKSIHLETNGKEIWMSI